MADNDLVQQDEYEDEDERRRREGPRQQVEITPETQGQEGYGPRFPSGTNTVEAAVGGATADMNDDEIATLRGEARRTDTTVEGDQE
jgi:hypothetical protein